MADFQPAQDDSRDVWCDCDDSEKDMVYLNLQLNPERFTGYVGYNATRIWLAIYKENCFQPRGNQGLCLEGLFVLSFSLSVCLAHHGCARAHTQPSHFGLSRLHHGAHL